jgi:outer membrane protein assembly factor BamB
MFMTKETTGAFRTCVIAAFLLCLAAGSARAGDWPQWRHDASRSGITTNGLPASLSLIWSRQFPRPRRAWNDASNSKLFFDTSYEPIVMDGRIFVPSMVSDSVTAYDTETGKEVWRFYADGPVRFAPVAQEGKVYFVSDDGYLYCLDAKDGDEEWKVRGGPDDRKLIGNGRMISAWPARGAPVIYDGVLYFAAGIWPFMGTFIHAVDPSSGQVLWTNSGSGCNWQGQPHSSPAFAGVAPQGYLAANDELLLVPGGRSVPGAYARKTGKFLYFNHEAGKSAGGYHASLFGEYFVNGNRLYEAKKGAALGSAARGVFSTNACYYAAGGVLCSGEVSETEKKDRRGTLQKSVALKKTRAFDLNTDIGTVFLRAGDRLYASSGTNVLAVDLLEDGNASNSWQHALVGEPWSMLAGDDKLFVVTKEGTLYCFGEQADDAADPIVHVHAGCDEKAVVDAVDASNLIKACGVNEGICVVLGVDDGRLIEGLVATSSLQIVALDASARKIKKLRSRFQSKGIGCASVHFIESEPFKHNLPPYCASLVLSESWKGPGPRFLGIGPRKETAGPTFKLLRPYGGLACFGMKRGNFKRYRTQVDAAGLERAELTRNGNYSVLAREGSLPGSGQWTHQYGGPENSVVSDESRAKAPFGVLWFGGPTNDEILPRHGHGPSPQVAGGRLFIEGPNMIRAVDVYTGRVLWQRDFKGLGKFYDNTGHQPGAGEIGSNYVSLEDAVYIMKPGGCTVLDPVTGKTTKEFTIPAADAGKKRVWGFIMVTDDLLVAALSPAVVPNEKSPLSDKPDKKRLLEIPGAMQTSEYSSASGLLVVMDRYTGERLWQREAAYSYRHNTIIAGKDKLFFIDGVSPEKTARLVRRGIAPHDMARLFAVNKRSGKVVWTKEQHVFSKELAALLLKRAVDPIEKDAAQKQADLKKALEAALMSGEAAIKKTFDDKYAVREQKGISEIADTYRDELAKLEKKNAKRIEAALKQEANARQALEAFLKKKAEAASAVLKVDAEPEPAAKEDKVEPGVEEDKVEPEVEEDKVEPEVEEDKVEPEVEEDKVEPEVEEDRAEPVDDGEEIFRKAVETASGELAAVREKAAQEKKVAVSRTEREKKRETAALKETLEKDKRRAVAEKIDSLRKDTQDRAKKGAAAIASEKSRGIQEAVAGLEADREKREKQATGKVFGTFLGYSAKYDVLVQSGSGYRDRARDENNEAIIAYRGEDGNLLWKHAEGYSGPLLIHDKKLITNGANGYGLDLLSGKRLKRTDPLTGSELDFAWSRMYGCNTAVAGQNIMLFRSAAAGFFDLENNGGTANFGGFKSSCTANLIPADGLINAPDYTRTCTCSYQNQTSLALIHMPDAETWTFYAYKWNQKPVTRLGLNFGAPGDRVAGNGSYWLDYPSVGGPSPDVPVKLTFGKDADLAHGSDKKDAGKKDDDRPANNTFRSHASTVAEGDLKWVAASGLIGVRTIAVTVESGAKAARIFDLKLYFTEPDPGAKKQGRVFDVVVQGKEVLSDLDIYRQTGGAMRELVHEIRGVAISNTLELAFSPSSGQPVISGLELIHVPQKQGSIGTGNLSKER